MSDPLISSKITTAQDLDRSLVELGFKIASTITEEKSKCISLVEAEIHRRLKDIELSADATKSIYPIVVVLKVSDAVLEWLENVYTAAGYKVFSKFVRPSFVLPFQALLVLMPAGTTQSPFTEPFIASLVGTGKEAQR